MVREFIFGCDTFPLQPVFRWFDPLFQYGEYPVAILQDTVLMPLHTASDFISNAAGLSPVEARYLVIFLSSFLLAVILRNMRNPLSRHFFCLVWGLLFGIFAVGVDTLHSFTSTLPVFLLMRVAPKPIVARLCCLWAFCYMVVGHLYRMSCDYEALDRLDWTMMQLVITLKLCAWACTLSDGHLPLRQQDNLHDFQKKNMVQRQPSLLEYYSYIFFFPTYSVGPFFEFNDYISFINRSMFAETHGNVPPGWGKTLIMRMLHIPITLVLVLGFGHLFQKEDLANIGDLPFWYRWVWLWMFMIVTRCSFYFSWMMGEGAAIITGFSYRKDASGAVKWDRLQNVDIWGVELSQSLVVTVAEWNKGTAYWLKHYVYLRWTPKGGRPPGHVFYLVYAVSSLWHGFYPGYYLFFLMFGFFQSAATSMRRKFRPLFMKKIKKGEKEMEIGNYPLKYVWDLLGFITSAICLNYLATSFVLLHWDLAIQVLSAFYFIPHICAVAIFVLAKSLQTLNLFTIQDACARSSAPRSSNEKELMKTWAERFSPTFNERTIVLRINEMCLSSA